MPTLVPSTLEAARDALAAQLRQQSFGQIRDVGLATLGAGLGARGLIGLYNVARRNLFPTTIPGRPRVMDIPYVPEEQEDKQTKKAEIWTDLLSNTPKAVGDLFAGRYAQSPDAIPWTLPAKGLAGVAGGVAGWKLMDYLLDKRRKQELDAELGAARGEYEQALVPTKTASLADDLDELSQLAEKKAVAIPGGNAVGATLGAYGLISLLPAYLAAKTSYDFFKKRQPPELLEKARKKLERERELRRPSPIFARPMPLAPTGRSLVSPSRDVPLPDDGTTDEI